jgi:hypothetical protein
MVSAVNASPIDSQPPMVCLPCRQLRNTGFALIRSSFVVAWQKASLAVLFVTLSMRHL